MVKSVPIKGSAHGQPIEAPSSVAFTTMGVKSSQFRGETSPFLIRRLNWARNKTQKLLPRLDRPLQQRHSAQRLTLRQRDLLTKIDNIANVASRWRWGLIVRAQFWVGNSRFFSWVKIGLAAALVIGAGASMSPSSARSRHYPGAEAEQKQSAQKKQPAEEPPPPAGPLFILISTDKQTISVYGKDGLYARGPVSTGQPDHPTPHGIFTILTKELYHASNIYSGAPMPFMQRITYSGVAMHEGVLPGYPASHGCIRLPHEFAKRMFDYTKGNERVIISRVDITPANISHPRLPVAKLMALPNGNFASGSAQILKNAIETTSAGSKVDIAIKPGDNEGSEGQAAQQLLNPLEFAKSMQEQAAKKAQEAATALTPLQRAADAKAREAKAAALELKKEELSHANAKSRLEFAVRYLEKVSGEQAIEKATAAKVAAEEKLKEAQDALEAAKRTKIAKEEEAAAAMAAFKEADNLKRAAADAVTTWNRRLEPLSIFISRKSQRLYIRQAYMKVFDVPIAIRDPQKPIGTHLFIAMPPAQEGSQTELRWLALTLPETATPSGDDFGG